MLIPRVSETHLGEILRRPCEVFEIRVFMKENKAHKMITGEIEED